MFCKVRWSLSDLEKKDNTKLTGSSGHATGYIRVDAFGCNQKIQSIKEKPMKPIATVINNNQPGWTNIIETEPNVTLEVGIKLYLPEPFAEIGSPLAGGFFAGEITIEGDRYALIVAPKASGEKLELEYKPKDRGTADGTDSDDDGPANTKRINDVNHPAAQFCSGLNIGGFDDWYLPSRDELAMLERNLGPYRKNTPEQFREDAPEALETNWYWSSTEYASYSYLAWIVGFDSGLQNGFNKDLDYGVRAVRRLKL
jgi:hypothetical protein